jgi:MFS family permease
MSSVNSMVQFRTYFDISLDSKTSLLFVRSPPMTKTDRQGIYTVGSVCSFFGASIIPDLFGRRYGMFIGNTILIVGALISGLATKFGMLLGGRFLTGFGGGIANNSSKSYLTEITPPTTRGRWMGLLNSFYYGKSSPSLTSAEPAVGQILATGISIPFGKRLYSTSSWRAPILVQIAPAIINVAFIMFLPESPRWLYSRGRREEAVRILAKYHSKTGDINSPMIQLEIQEIEERISLDGADKRWWDFRALFK